MSRKDPHSYTDLEQGVTENIQLKLLIDFDKRILHGSVRLHLAEPVGGSFDLDTRALKILSCESGEDSEISWSMGAEDPIFGQRMRLDLAPGTDDISITFETTENSTALDWLEPAQTAGGRLPYLYSQCQPHHARSIFPCQDSPQVRFGYSAEIEVPEDFTAVMAAASAGVRDGNAPGSRCYLFEMPQPIPSYLTAFAVGDIDFRDLSDRVRIWAEPEVLDKAAWEFAEVDSMISVAEGIFGPYVWDRYDMLVMPFSFPYGGMENPRLTFLTPTLLAGDRSLVNVVAHELAHSWTGNLVTNATMEDFWINEGFTVWAERRILEALEGEDYAALHAAIGRNSLSEAMERFGPTSPYTRLKTAMEGVDPDEVYSEVPYEKGFLFVTLMEQTLGREAWDEIVARYIQRFRFKSITTEVLLDFLEEQAPGLLRRTAAHRWVYEEGLPENAPKFSSPRLEKVRALAEAFEGGVIPTQEIASGWSPEEWQLYLQALGKTISEEGCRSLEERFKLSESGNYEILVGWLALAVRSGFADVLPRVREVLTSVGRGKFLRPLYSALLGREEFRPFAAEVFEEMKERYHTLARVAVEGLFKSI